VQQALADHGINPGVVDGTFGHFMGAAVFAFQKINELVADCVVGPSTAKKPGVPWPNEP
jgi:peptidoglycan hydrolase-like protein with peptidoglycan-binding domain